MPTQTAHSAASGNEGTSAADFALVDARGNTVRLSDYRGKVVILDFWATWCGPCRMEIPGFVALQTRYKGQGVEVIGVSVDDSWAPVRQFIQAQNINYTVVLGDRNVASTYGNIEGIPTTFVIDKDGVIRARHVGYAPPEFFTEKVESLL